MDEYIKEFIEKNIALIEQNKWEEVYKSIYSLLDYFNTGKFTEAMLKANIDPLDYLDYIPKYYLHGSNILEKFVIPNGVTSIGNEAFYNCRGLTNVVIPDSVTSIGDYAFRNCSSLTNIVIPDSVTSIGDTAFECCRGLMSVTIPNSVTSIGRAVFSNCSGLTSITIPDSIISIEDWAFFNCSGLTSITIPNDVTSIGEYAFRGCSELKDIYYNGTKEQWENIRKGTNWKKDSSIGVIHCIDEDIELK